MYNDDYRAHRHALRQARLDGYRAALGRSGIAAAPALVAEGDIRFEPAFASARELRCLDQRPTAIIAVSDVRAMGLYGAHQHGLRIPKDLSVIGFGDIPSAAWRVAPLARVRQPLAEMAALAVRFFVPGNSADYNIRPELSTNVVERSSTAAPANLGG